MKIKLIPLLLVLCLILCCGCAQTETTPPEESAPVEETAPPEELPKADIPQDNLGFDLGKTMPDFSFTTFDGKEMSLYATLAEKEVVLLNIWASWCEPCAMEFPYMEEAYRQYKDSVEIFAISGDSRDTNEVLADYVSEKGLSFPVAMDTSQIVYTLGISSFPTTVVIDRFGTICAIEVGAKTSTEEFTEIFDRLLAEDWTGYETGMNLTLPPCEVAPSSPEELNEALGGSSIVFGSVDSKYIWPMTVGEYDGRSVVASSNFNIDRSSSVLTASLEAKAGDVLSICFALSSEDGMDNMRIFVNDKQVKCFNGEYDWTTYAYEFPADGSYEIRINYEKDDFSSYEEDTLWLDSVKLLSGAEAEAALAASPKYVYGDTVSLEMLTPGTREIIFNDPLGILVTPEYTGIIRFYIVNGSEAQMRLTLTPDYDPENYVLICDYDYSFFSLPSVMNETGYTISSGVDTIDTTGYNFSTIYVAPATSDYSDDIGFLPQALLFADEENLNAFIDDVNAHIDSLGATEHVSWNYADEVEAPASPLRQYSVRCIDEAGKAVPGVTVQICDETLCNIYVTDDRGECSFTLKAYPYEAHLLAFPEGYEAVDAVDTLLPEEGGTVTFLLKTK